MDTNQFAPTYKEAKDQIAEKHGWHDFASAQEHALPNIVYAMLEEAAGEYSAALRQQLATKSQALEASERIRRSDAVEAMKELNEIRRKIEGESNTYKTTMDLLATCVSRVVALSDLIMYPADTAESAHHEAIAVSNMMDQCTTALSVYESLKQ